MLYLTHAHPDGVGSRSHPSNYHCISLPFKWSVWSWVDTLKHLALSHPSLLVSISAKYA